jgi:hypothetical protein
MVKKASILFVPELGHAKYCGQKQGISNLPTSITAHGSLPG